MILFAFWRLCLVLRRPSRRPAQGGGREATNWVAITSGFAMAIASAACGIAQARASCRGLAKAWRAIPERPASIQNMLILALVLIESMALYTFAIIFVKVK